MAKFNEGDRVTWHYGGRIFNGIVRRGPLSIGGEHTAAIHDAYLIETDDVPEDREGHAFLAIGSMLALIKQWEYCAGEHMWNRDIAGWERRVDS